MDFKEALEKFVHDSNESAITELQYCNGFQFSISSTGWDYRLEFLGQEIEVFEDEDVDYYNSIEAQTNIAQQVKRQLKTLALNIMQIEDKL